nr:autotransporter outer membrane beta-barrel domain-containing protein [Snodgrassella alvi]
MNNIYKSKWSEATQTWVACSELVRGKTKNNCVKITATIALALTSLGSYADDIVPCDNNVGSVVVSGTTCSLPSLPDDKSYTEISGSANADLTGGDINVIGSTKVKKVINVDGESTLKATNITTTNKVNSKGTNALAIAGGSTVDIDENLTATNMGNKADTIVNSGGSTLTVGKDLTINDDKGFSNGIQNIENSTIRAENITITSKKVGFSNDGILNKDNSAIDVKGEIRITSEGSDGNASIENTDGGKIHAGNITIDQGGKNYAIHQTSETSSIIVDKDLNITSGNIPEGNSTVTIEGGSIEVKGKTDITTHVDSEYIDDPKNVSAISITNGKYTANGGADIKIKDDDEEDFTAAAGVILGNEGIFENNGTLTVNGKKDENTEGKNIEGKNTVIATDTKSGEKATFTNNADGTTTSNVDTIVHNSAGTLIVKNHGDLNSNGGSVLKNDNTGTIEAVNDGILTGKIDNNSTGTIKLDNNVNPNRDPDPKKKDNRGIVNSEITNRNTGTINITNNSTLDGSITNTGNVSTVAANNIDITNNGVLNSDINNDGKGTIALNNNGSVYSNITNTGDKIDENTDNILIDNKKNLNGNINNDGNGSIVVNNNTASSVINGNITNTKDGNITLDNKGTFDGYIKNKGTGSLSLTNDNTVSGYIENNGTGRISLTNNGTINGSITNTGTKNNVDNIWINNNKDLNSTIENRDGSIVVDNNTKDSSFTGDIYNNTGEITVNNNKEDTKINSHINNIHGGSININNKAKTSTIKGDITNINGIVNIKNSGEANYSKITNSGGRLNIDNENDGDFLGNIDNDATGTGSIDITNRGKNFDGSITNQNTGIISITNDTTFNSNITNNNTGTITLDNDGEIASAILNGGAGAINITNGGTLGGSVTNTGDKGTADNIVINNNYILNSTINNEGNGSIVINNNTASSVIKGKSIHTKAADTDTKVGINGDITNKNTGTITLKNSGNIQNKIENSGSGLIDITNDNTGNIASTILNGGAGIIDITNDGTLSGSITNTGDPNTVTANNIDIKNSTTGNIVSKILNGGAGNIKITNNGTISGSTTDDELPNSIENTGTGNISLINDGKIASDILNGAAGSGIKITNNNTLSGTITNTNSGSVYATNTGTFTGMTTNSGSGILDLDNQGIWNNTGNSVLTRLKNTTGTIIFPQVSEVNAGDKDQYHTITVNGNYTGGGLMRVNTVWNKNGTSYSDRVDIHGDVDGAPTTVRTLNGIYGDVTLKEIPIHSAVVVHVAGKSSGNDFTGSAPTTNAGEAQLKKIDTTSGTDYAWTLTAQNKTPEPTNPGVSGPTDPNVSGPTDPNVSGPTAPDKPILPAPPITEVPIYAEPVSGYVQMPTADMELGFTTISTLHERRGENQTYNITGSNNTALGGDQQQTWGRVLVKHLDKDGKKRLDTAGNQSVLQIGHDFILDENEKTGIRRHIGGYVAYGHNENDFRDEYRAKNGYIVDDHYTGKGRTDAVSVGGYGTFYGNNGGYVDLVGQVTYLRNKYNARSNESVHQNGWGAALSAETGKSFIVYGNNWFVEPQAQLVYQYLSLDDFNDRIRHVDQHDPSALRGRVGMRFGYNGDTRDNLPSSSFYGIANIWHDFVNPKSVDIGRDSLKEEYAKTWGELGLGIQLPITRQSDFYSDIRYEKNFGSDKRKGFKGTMGYKYTWL